MKRKKHIFFYKHTLLWAEPGKEIEITTYKLTMMCLKYGRFLGWCAYKPRSFKKTYVNIEPLCFDFADQFS